MTVTPTNSLCNFALFEGMTIEKTNAIGEHCTWQRYPKNHVLVTELEDSTDVFFVVDGTAIARSFSADGKEITYLEINRGDVFGEFSAIDQKPRSASVTTHTECYIGRMASNPFRNLICNEPQFALNIATHLVAKNRNISQRIYEYSVLNVRQRVCAELLRLCKNGELSQLDNMPTHHMLATRIGTHREAVSRELSRLNSNGIIITKGKTLTIENIDSLRHASQI